jgi:heme exporter protein CcmD
MADFLNMGGYAGFIWPSWGVASLVIVAVSAHAVIKARRIKQKLNTKKDSDRAHG